MKVKSESEVVQSCPTLSDPMDSNLPDYFGLEGIFEEIEWGANQKAVVGVLVYDLRT